MNPRTATLLCAAAAACSTGPVCTPEQRAEIAAFQAAVRREMTRPEADLFVPGMLFELPEGWELRDLDLNARTGVGVGEAGGELQSAFVLKEGNALRAIAWREGHLSPDPLDPRIYRLVERNPSDRWFVAAAGATLRGFDEIHRYALTADDGITLVGERDGARLIVVGDRVFGVDFDPAYRPTLSRDGKWICYVSTGLFSRDGVLAPTDALGNTTVLDSPCDLDWPVFLAPDGAHWAAEGTAGDAHTIVYDGQLVGRFDKVLGPMLGDAAFVPAWKVQRDGRTALVLGTEATPWFDDVGWPERSADGRVLAFRARDGEEDRVYVGAEVVFTHPHVVGLAIAPDGAQWAAATQEDDGVRIVHGERVHGPLPPSKEFVKLWVEGDSVLVYFDSFVGPPPRRLYLNDQQLGAEFARIEHPQLAPGGGYAFVGWTGDGYYLVTAATRSGPWDWIGGRRLSADGARLAFVAGRGREVWRLVVAVR